MELISKPIDDIESLLKWSSTRDNYKLYNSRVPLAKGKLPQRPRLLVCHDMRGGYLHDKYVQGCDCSTVYTLIYHQMVDVFVYFSHHLITTPPAQWIDFCHQNGIPVLGVFITEGESGSQICERLFSDERSATTVANAMGELAKELQFDGWLINIENEINFEGNDGLSNIEIMSFVFLPCLKAALGDGLLIWYDAVTTFGQLIWQNKLNELNKTFFDICDGIFLNYNWTRADLSTSRANSIQRVSDVYAGVDVFARGKCIGGFDTPLALKEIANFELSAAIFAPGWVMECLGEEEFLKNQAFFWKSMASKVNFNVPLRTCFCPGRGTMFYVVQKKEEMMVRKLYNTSWSYLPMTTFIPCGATITETDAFIGGSCLDIVSDQICIADFNASAKEFELCIATKSGRISILVDYFKDDKRQTRVFTEQTASMFYRVQGWLWRKHLVKFETDVKLDKVYAVTSGSARLGLFCIGTDDTGNEPINPKVYRIKTHCNRLYLIVRICNSNHDVVNAFLSGEKNCLLASTTGEYVCLIFELQSTKTNCSKLEFVKWKSILDPLSCHMEYVSLDFEQGTVGNNISHITEEDERIFTEMFRSVG